MCLSDNVLFCSSPLEHLYDGRDDTSTSTRRKTHFQCDATRRDTEVQQHIWTSPRQGRSQRNAVAIRDRKLLQPAAELQYHFCLERCQEWLIRTPPHETSMRQNTNGAIMQAPLP